MANNKAEGKDKISVEMLKYIPDIVFEKIAQFPKTYSKSTCDTQNTIKDCI